jgi:SAM-dependent methyltransferase
MNTLPDLHLDLGCGPEPRNPYGRSRLCGIDIRALPAAAGTDIRVANLAVDPIPFADGMFGSVSAFDFIEHIPRLLPSTDGRGTRAPFIELMNEIWRVLAPGGRLWALTPAFPHAEAFQDPTHCNFITEGTHLYFCGPRPYGASYGFKGCFDVKRVAWVLPEHALTDAPLSFGQRWRHVRRRAKGRLTHLLWDLEAVKP